MCNERFKRVVASFSSSAQRIRIKLQALALLCALCALCAAGGERHCFCARRFVLAIVTAYKCILIVSPLIPAYSSPIKNEPLLRSISVKSVVSIIATPTKGKLCFYNIMLNACAVNTDLVLLTKTYLVPEPRSLSD